MLIKDPELISWFAKRNVNTSTVNEYTLLAMIRHKRWFLYRLPVRLPNGNILEISYDNLQFYSNDVDRNFNYTVLNKPTLEATSIVCVYKTLYPCLIHGALQSIIPL